MNHEMVPAHTGEQGAKPAERAVGELEDAVLGEPSNETLSPDSAIDDLEAAVGTDVEGTIDDLEGAINPDLDEAIDALEDVVGSNDEKNLHTNTADELIDPPLSKKVSALNKLDTKLRKSTMLIARQKHLETKINKLVHEQKKYPYGSRKEIRLRQKHVNALVNLDRVTSKQNKIFSRLQTRSLGNQETARNYIYQEHAKDIIIMRHKLAVEQKYRRKTIEKEKRAKTKRERAHLKSEISSWKSISELEKELREKIDQKLIAKKATLLS